MTSALAAAALLLGAGCGTADTEATTTDLLPNPYNVCQELPDEALEVAGLDPATKNVITDPPAGPSTWRVCSWDPADSAATYRVELYSTSHTMEETRQNENLTDFTETTIAGREDVTFLERNTADTRCRSAFGAEQGSFVVSTAWFERGEKPGDLCGLAVQYLSDLEPALPN